MKMCANHVISGDNSKYWKSRSQSTQNFQSGNRAIQRAKKHPVPKIGNGVQPFIRFFENICSPIRSISQFSMKPSHVLPCGPTAWTQPTRRDVNGSCVRAHTGVSKSQTRLSPRTHSPHGIDRLFLFRLDRVLVGLDHLLDHLSANGTCLLGSEIAVVTLLQVYTNLACSFHLESLKCFLSLRNKCLVAHCFLLF